MEPSDKIEMLRFIRLLLYAAIDTECEAIVLSALGCGPSGHDAEEVATMFKTEFYRVGGDLPVIYFAILDDKKDATTLRNFEAFKNILVRPELFDSSWKTAKEIFKITIHLSTRA